MSRIRSLLSPGTLNPAWAASLRRGFAAQTGGATAILFSLCLMPLLIAVGCAVDYSTASLTKAKLDSAIDAAALETVSRSMLPETAATARANGLKVFANQAGLANRTTIDNISLTVTDTVSERKSVATYTAQVSTAFLGVVGIRTIAVAGTSSTASVLAPYIDFYLLLDNTPSMGVGATPADVALMVKNTPDKCAFACHDISAAGNDYYKLAKKLGVTMRIDVLRQATQRLMDEAKTTALLPDQFRMAIYTFGPSCGSLGLTAISRLTKNLTKAKNDADDIDLMTVPYQNFNNDQCTDYDSMLTAMNATVPAAGPGTATSPQKYVFFVSDGVADAYNPAGCARPTTGGRCQEPIDVQYCKTLKDRGVKIAVLYTTYLPLPDNGWYNTWIKPFAPQINPTMQSCASPGLFFEVTPTQGISEALTALFQKAVAQARFTN